MSGGPGYALGIDLGTTYAAAAVARGDLVEVCTLGSTAAQIPSVVVLRDDGEILTGEAAERRAAGEPARTAREFKRRLGDPVPVIVGTTPYAPEALMAHLLRSIVEQVAAREGSVPDVVVLTHPANYSEYKRGLLLEVARLADLDLGLGRVLFVTEPEAAAIAYARQERVDVGEVVAVYDFGGGTFDAAVVRKTTAGFELIGTPEGIERLGGIDVDQAVMAHVDASLGGLVSAADASDPPVRAGQARLRDECRRAKEALSTDTDTSIPVSLPGLQTDVRLTREELESMIRPRVAETVQALERAIRSAGVELTDVSRVLLVGGSSRIPAVAQVVRERTGLPVTVDAHPKFAIATGAALVGAAAGTNDAPEAVPEAPAPVGTRGHVDSSVGPAAAAVGVGAGSAAALGAAALLGHDTATAAAPNGGVSVAGPAGAPLGAAGPAGPAGTPLAAGPAGVGVSAGPRGESLQTAGTAASRARPRMAIVAGAVVVVTLAIGSVVVLAGRGDGSGPSAATTASSLTTVPRASAGNAPVGTDAPGTTKAGVAGRGIDAVVELVAGNGSDNGAGRPGPARDASLGSNVRFAVAPNGDVFSISASPVVLLVRDNTVKAIYTGGTGEFSFGGIAVGPDGNAYVTMSTGVKRISADGSSALVVDAKANGLGSTFGPVTFDGLGNLYFYDATTYRVLRRGTDGSLSHVAGTGAQGPAGRPPVGDGGPATAAPLSAPVGLVVDGRGNLLIADSGQAVVRSVSGTGTITTVAGNGAVPMSPSVGRFAPDGIPASNVQLGVIGGVAVDRSGRVYVSDGLNHVIIRFTPGAGIELVIADQANTAQSTGQPANQTRIRNAGVMAIDAAGDLVFVDTNTLLRIVRAAG